MPDRLNEHVGEAERLLDAGDYEASLVPLDAVLAAPDASREQRFRAFVAAGAAHSNLGRPARALELYEQALQLDTATENADVRYGIAIAMRNRGAVLFKLGRWQHSYDQYLALVERFREDPDGEIGELALQTTVDLANAAIELGSFDEAVGLVEHALEELRARAGSGDERVLVAMSVKANALLRGGKESEAAAVLLELVDNDPDRMMIPAVAGAAYNFGAALERKGRPGLARAVYEELDANLSHAPSRSAHLRDIIDSIRARLVGLAANDD